MTDRHYSYTVVLDHDIREDDAEVIMNALRCIKHVIAVKPNVSDSALFAAQARAAQNIREQLYKLAEEL